MKTACCLLALLMLSAAAHAAPAPDEPIDTKKLRALHERVKSGGQLTPEEQAYYERGKAERLGKGRTGRKAPEPAPKASAETAAALVPLTDMGATDSYKGEDGGLYGKGSNTPPEAHLKAALELAASIQPLDAGGKPAPDGKIVLLTHGMSNTTNESQRFIELANSDQAKNPNVLLIDGAQGGIDSRKWVEDTHTRRDTSPWETLDKRVKAAGATPQQVQVVWMKHAVARPAPFGEFPKHATQLKDDTAKILRMLKERFPNLKIAYLSSRSYAGYAGTDLNPEPFAYESAFAVRSLIQDQIKGEPSLDYKTGRLPLLLWGPYLWANGEKGRKFDDLAYSREDFREDGTHPSDSGRQKIAEQLLGFFTKDATAKVWFVKH
jgi:hypothetical protein